jgi:hypothetical protein
MFRIILCVNHISSNLIDGEKVLIFFVIPWFEYRKRFEFIVHAKNEEILNCIEFYAVEVPNAEQIEIKR